MAPTVTKTAVVVAAACAETVGAVVVEAEANVGVSRDRGSSADGNRDGNVGTGICGGNGRQQRQQGPKQGWWWQRRQQWLGWQITTETAVAGNNKKNVAAVVGETVVVAATIVAVQL